MRKQLAKLIETVDDDFRRGVARPKSYTDVWSRKLISFLQTMHGLGAFALITLGVMLGKRGVAPKLIRPRIREEIYRSGIALLPMFLFMAAGLGFLVAGEAVSEFVKFNATQYIGSAMIVVIVRELGPLLAVMLLLARVGTAHVIELGTARATGEVETLEALGIDPVHYLIVPRVIGMVAAMFSLTIYLIVVALLSGYLCTFLMNSPLTAGQYFTQLADALTWLDFVVLFIKMLILGFLIAVVACYHGLAQPLRLEDVSGMTVRAVAQGVVIPMLIDLGFIGLYVSTSTFL